MDGMNARDCAVKILVRVEKESSFAAAVLEKELALLENPKDVALTNEIVYGVLRKKTWIDHLLNSAAKKGLYNIDNTVLYILRVATYQLAFLDRVPISAAVNEAVNQTKNGETSHLAPLVNALLRNLSRRTKEELLPNEDLLQNYDEPLSDNPYDKKITPKDVALNFSVPTWICEKIINDRGLHESAKIFKSFNKPSKRSIRINTHKTSVELAQEKLGDIATKSELLPWSLDVTARAAARSFEEAGEGIIQDEGAGLVVLAFNPQKGEDILDACAGRGGKTGAIAMLTANDDNSTQVTAVDKKGNKLKRLVIELEKQNLIVKTKPVDLTKKTPELDNSFDAILLDAPCSGTGTIGRRPEIRWNLQPEDVKALFNIQTLMLTNVAPMVKPGGRLIFAVCSVLKTEYEGHIEQFLKDNPDFSLIKTPPDNWPDQVDWNNGAPFVNPYKTNSDGYGILCFTKNL